MKIDLNGQVALVTGSSRGIGRMCALYLAEAGCDIVVNYKTDKASGEKTCEEVRAKGRKAHLVQCDVVDSKQVEDLVKSGIAHFGKIDVLVNNAGITRDMTFKKMDKTNFELNCDEMTKFPEEIVTETCSIINSCSVAHDIVVSTGSGVHKTP